MQADILTLASMGCHPLSVITAITVQDSLGVEGMLAIDSDWVADQARRLLEDMPVDAFKIGVLGSVENIAAIAEIVSDYPDVPLIFDPVLASGRGDELADDDMTHAMRELLLPQTTILTPNSVEVRLLAEEDEEDEQSDSLAQCAAKLVERAASTCSSRERTRTPPTSSTRCTARAASCAPTTGLACRARITAPAARLRPRSRPCSPTASTLSEAVREAQEYHVAGAAEGVPARHGAVPARPPVLGARGGRGAQRGHRVHTFRRCALTACAGSMR